MINIPFFRDLSIAKRHTLTDSIYNQCPLNLQYIIDCLQERGSLSWLTSLPIEQHRFVLHKGDFIDGFCLQYGWTPPRLPSHCVCGSNFSLFHIHLAALTVPFPPSDIITSVILLLHLCLRFAIMMLRLNLFSNQL